MLAIVVLPGGHGMRSAATLEDILILGLMLVAVAAVYYWTGDW